MEINFCPRWLLRRMCVPEDSQTPIGLFFSALLILAAVPLAVRIPHLCLVQYFLHVPCPGCGILHSILATVNLRFADAWRNNPAGIFLTAMLVFQVFAQPIAIMAGESRRTVMAASARMADLCALSLGAVWIVRLMEIAYA